VSAHLYIEGGESKDDQILCRKGFRKLLEKSGLSKRLPKLSACGSRSSALDDFKTAHASRKTGEFIAMLIDSEDPMADTEKTWAHLKKRDNWARPAGAADEQVLCMTTCMETWIAADHAALEKHYGSKLQKNTLPSLVNLEKRERHTLHDALVHATRNCKNAYAKGRSSFEVLAKLDPAVLQKRLPSFARVIRILNEKL
jgi:hypothetical protein